MSKDINKNSMDNLFRGFTTSENIENMQEESSAVEVASSSVDSTPRKKRNSSKQPTGIRISTIVEVNLMDKVKTIAATEGINIKDIINKGMRIVVEKYEEKNGVIRVHRPKKKGNIDELLE